MQGQRVKIISLLTRIDRYADVLLLTRRGSIVRYDERDTPIHDISKIFIYIIYINILYILFGCFESYKGCTNPEGS